MYNDTYIYNDTSYKVINVFFKQAEIFLDRDEGVGISVNALPL